jgi:hypothetical protein
MNWAKIWKIFRPVATLGISVIIDLITKTDTPANTIINTAAKGAGSLIIDELDTVVNNSSDTEFTIKDSLPEAIPGTDGKTIN